MKPWKLNAAPNAEHLHDSAAVENLTADDHAEVSELARRVWCGTHRRRHRSELRRSVRESFFAAAKLSLTAARFGPVTYHSETIAAHVCARVAFTYTPVMSAPIANVSVRDPSLAAR